MQYCLRLGLSVGVAQIWFFGGGSPGCALMKVAELRSHLLITPYPNESSETYEICFGVQLNITPCLHSISENGPRRTKLKVRQVTADRNAIDSTYGDRRPGGLG
jgi:hypothetical protein